jgi:hypothetical protein
MKLIAAVELFALLLNVVLVQVTPTALKPTKLEAFTGSPTAHVKWSKEVGRIDEARVHAVVTVLSVEDVRQPPHRMRGIRIDLTNESATDQIYLEEDTLTRIKSALGEIQSGIESFRRDRSDTPIRYFGAEEFWRPYERIHTLNAAYYIRPDSSGLSLSAYKSQEFRFPGHTPSELAELIGRAIRELQQN